MELRFQALHLRRPKHVYLDACHVAPLIPGAVLHGGHADAVWLWLPTSLYLKASVWLGVRRWLLESRLKCLQEFPRLRNAGLAVHGGMM